ncbi:hypothetical protein WICPIJ_003883 [Wickerhamomyces pijperi]|uniref:Uncharacterized protein n=1 Tax=Wickerhamomyces pijperi TaxID=599730 RepID=A0A9P8TNT0_WICPI|nr:hypothetical protein WICPIJ_003883 [Wickerhamomyces pijperi]
MGEGGGWGRISQIIGWDVDSLDRGDGTLLGGGNTFFGNFGTGLGESENVVNEQQDILTFFVSEATLDSPSKLMTPVSFISRYKSLPSLVRSPTPVKTEKPPWALAMLLINSWMKTVLPTPAPPNKPILPPLAYGANKSTTLIPVSKTSAAVDCSAKEGGSA